MRNLTKTALLLGATAMTLVGTSTLLAQSGGRGGVAGAMQQPPVNILERTTFNLEFRGGSIADYTDLVREKSGFSNIVVSGNADRYPMPPATLRAISVWDAVKLIEALPHHDNLMVDVEDFESALVVSVRDRSRNAAGAPIESAVWSIANLLGQGLDADDVLTAIEVGIELLDGESTMRFHQETSILMARGPMDHLEMITRILAEMRESSKARAEFDKARALAAQAQDLQAEIERMAMERIEVRRQAEIAMKEAMEVRDRLAQTEQEMARQRMISLEEAAKERLSLESALVEMQTMQNAAEQELQVARQRLMDREARIADLESAIEALQSRSSPRGGGGSR